MTLTRSVVLYGATIGVAVSAMSGAPRTLASTQQSAPAPAAAKMTPDQEALMKAPELKVKYERGPHTREEFEELLKQSSNWGRWGTDDQLGALNLITEQKRRQAAGVVKHGIAVTLAMDDRGVIKHQFGSKPAGEFFAGSYQLSGHDDHQTHIDALCHMWWGGQTYNGYTAADVIGDKGCNKLGLSSYRAGIVTRAVLVDIPRLKGVPYLEPATAVYAEDLEAWEKKTGLKIGSGDAILVRVGRWTRNEKFPEHPNIVTQLTKVGQAGLHPSVVPWLKQRGVALVGQDGGAGVFPSELPGMMAAFSIVAIQAAGIPLIVAMNLDEAAETAARLKQWDLLLTVGPLQFPQGTGSSVHPIGVF